MERLNPREASAIIYYRYTMRLSISHISKLIERSTKTVWNIISKNSWLHRKFDKRTYGLYRKYVSHTKFQKRKGILSWFFELWKESIIGNIHLLTGETAEGKPP